MRISNSDYNHKREDSVWSSWYQRELIKLHSLEILSWDQIGEVLQRSGESCKSHWKFMKNSNCIPLHIEFIKRHSNNNAKDFKINQQFKDTYNQDVDINILLSVDKILKENQWKIEMLDVLWNNVQNQPIPIGIIDDDLSNLRFSNLTTSD